MNNLITKNNNIVSEIRTNLEDEAVQTVALYNDRIKAYKTLEDIDERFLYLTALKAYAKDKFKVTAPKKVVEEYDFYIKINEEISNIAREYKADIINTMSKDAFEKLNKVSDTIPNILSQITGLSIILSRILKANFQAWSSEIDNTDLSNLIDTSEENLTSYFSMSNNDGILPYKSIFNKNKKLLEEINNFVLSMAETAGIKSSDLNTENQFKYINLMNYVNRGNVSNTYDPNVNEEDEDEDEDKEEEKPLSKSQNKKMRKRSGRSRRN